MSAPALGTTVGAAVGTTVSAAVSATIGTTVSAAVRATIGATVSAAVRATVGTAVRAAVGSTVSATRLLRFLVRSHRLPSTRRGPVRPYRTASGENRRLRRSYPSGNP